MIFQMHALRTFVEVKTFCGIGLDQKGDLGVFFWSKFGIF